MRKRLDSLIKKTFIYVILGLLLQAFSVNIIVALNVSVAQDLNDVEVNLNLVDRPLEKVFNEIEKQTEFRFSYLDKTIPLKSPTTIKAKNSSLKVVLNKIAALHNLSFKRINQQIIVEKYVTQNTTGKGKIRGIVLDANSKEPLIGANVIIKGTSIGAATDIEGKFALPKMKSGDYILKISYVGYKNKEQKITILSGRTVQVKILLDWIAVEGDEVLVTAQAKGQLSAINEQLSADEIKNVVSKDRIRELPDANAAESVGRLPGVSLVRSGGEGDKIVIRGLSPKYNKVMVDGVSLAATSKDDRSVSLSSISSYSLEGIEVIKAPTADMDGDQIGGSVNFKMKTADIGFKTNIVLEGGYNNLKNTYSDYMIVGDISNRFLDNKLGVFFQLTSDRKNLSSNQMNAGYYLDVAKHHFLRTESLALTDVVRIRNRVGGTLTLDYLLPGGKIYLKNFFSNGNNNEQDYSESFSRDRTHTYTTGTNDNDLLIYSNILGLEQEVSIFKIKLKLSHSYSGIDGLNNVDFNFTNDAELTTLPEDILPVDIPDLASGGINGARWTNYAIGDKITRGRKLGASLDFSTDFSLSKQINTTIKFGGKALRSDRSYDYRNVRGGYMRSLGGLPYRIAVLEAFPWMQKIMPIEKVQNEFDMPYELFINKDFEHGEFLKGRYKMGPVANVDLLRNIIDVLREEYKVLYSQGIEISKSYSSYYSNMAKTNITYDYSGFENLYAGYVMANINITDRIKLIPGIRYEAKKTTYTGVRGETGQYANEEYKHVDTTTIRKNNFLLPRLHLRVKAMDWLQIRLAYTKSLLRPDFYQINPRMDLYLRGNSVDVNNYKLRPEQASSYDINIAFSQNYLGLFTVGLFYKEIKDKIFYETNRILEHPEDLNIKQIYKGRYYSTAENNREMSYVRGIEVDWQTNFWYLPSFLKGLVLNVNYTKLISKTKYPLVKYESKVINTPPYIIKEAVDISYWSRMQQQPDDILNISLGYDYKDFSTRLSMFYQGDNFIEANFYEEKHILTDSYMRWDLSVKQKLPWYNVQLYGNIVNLNKAIDRNFIKGNKRDSKLEYYGSIFQLGLRWTL